MADTNKPTSTAAIVGLVLGILAIVTSWIPIVNNLSFMIGAIGLVFSIVGVIGTVRGTKGGKGLAIAALVVNVLSLVIVLGLQSAWSAALS
ncbi:hypothetical protein INF26_01620 [Olsenella sp. DSM 107455]|uniref:DUF4190 domain-containing protein n=1 Tax=Thermophilibacter gallinarum TaxID=2779357 RepID=A0ABR9QS59_9ACTN|nr:hypothetical protein [Thermophilibacter gallinarum]MBE5023552.1 hypothetical protein [Thermophilibacter gallinarum]